MSTSALATLPVLCMGVFAALAPALGRRYGTEAAITAALVLTTVGIVLRVLSSALALFAGTVLAGAGLAIGNALLPAVVKRHFPTQVGPMTGAAMMVLAASAAIAAAIAVPVGDAAGWRVALAMWAVPSLLAALAWGPLAVRGRTPSAADVTEEPPGSVARSPLAWAVAAFLGTVALMYYVLVAWVPQIMQAGGYSASQAGAMTSVMLALGIPCGYLTPLIASQVADQRPLALVLVQ